MERLVKTHQTGLAERYVYQPGNGTRYSIVYCPGPETFLFGWYNCRAGGRLAVFSSTAGLMTADYLMKKLDVTLEDAAALLVLVNELTGRPIELPQGYSAGGVYVGTTEMRKGAT